MRLVHEGGGGEVVCVLMCACSWLLTLKLRFRKKLWP